ncbi:hypothetical protein CDAR_521681 [Caerostris darwini]|uniref:Uncharacterized protein n=1 Tax=Caerostris darwini TaxID=1538125 RepID=A0AAV4PCH6_9ARAC|nr:hypothetical protein CDAR_521681 [Caerostris darwini]
MHPKQPQFADVTNVSLSKCYDRPLLGRSPSMIRDDSSARKKSCRPPPLCRKRKKKNSSTTSGISHTHLGLAKGAARTQPQLPKIMHPKQPQFADVANVSLSKCYDRPLLGRSSFMIRDDSSAR